MVGSVDCTAGEARHTRRLTPRSFLQWEVRMAAAVEQLAFDRSAAAADGVWTSIARCYAAFGSPLVPCREDIHAFEQAVAMEANRHGSGDLDAVMLGVTPGIALMDWPSGSRITAVDMSAAVIHALWPGDVTGVRKAVCASWLSMPIEPRSRDVVVGDGFLTAFRFPFEVRKLARAVSDLLRDGGVFLLRC